MLHVMQLDHQTDDISALSVPCINVMFTLCVIIISPILKMLSQEFLSLAYVEEPGVEFILCGRGKGQQLRFPGIQCSRRRWMGQTMMWKDR